MKIAGVAVAIGAAFAAGAAPPSRPAAPEVSVLAFGAVADGVTDDYAAFQRALDHAAVNGLALHVPAGTYALRGGSPPRRGLNLPAGTRLEGDGASASRLVVSGPGTFDSVLWIRNVSDVSVKGIGLRGNGQVYPSVSMPNDNNVGRALTVQLDHAGWSAPGFASPSGGVSGITIADNAFEHFNASGWLQLRNENDLAATSPSGNLSGVAIRGNVFTSEQGDCLYPTSPGHVSAAVWIGGASFVAGQRGYVTDATVAGNTFNVGYIQNGVVVFSGSSDITIDGNHIFDAGRLATGGGEITIAQYGVMVYDSGPAAGYASAAPTDVSISGNTIVAPGKSGVYAAGAIAGLNISGNTILGGAPVADRIPTGAIALNNPTSAAVVRNTIRSRAGGAPAARYGINVAITSNPTAAITIEDNVIEQVPPDGIGIYVQQMAGPRTSVELRRNSVATDSSAAYSVVNSYHGGRFVVRDLSQTGFNHRLSAYYLDGSDEHGRDIWRPYARFDEAPGFSIGGRGADAIRHRAAGAGEWSTQEGFDP